MLYCGTCGDVFSIRAFREVTWPRTSKWQSPSFKIISQLYAASACGIGNEDEIISLDNKIFW